MPWLIGVIAFSIRPLIDSIVYSFSNVYLTVNGLEKNFIGTENYYNLFYVDTNFTRRLITSVGDTLYRLPLILVLSIFIAIMLNNSFKGRLFFRGVFFLPIIIASGYVISIINGSATAAMLSDGINCWIDISTTSVKVCRVHVYHKLFTRHLFGVYSGRIGKPVVRVYYVELFTASHHSCYNRVVIYLFVKIFGITTGKIHTTKVVRVHIAEVAVNMVAVTEIIVGVYYCSHTIGDIVPIDIFPSDGH